MINTFSRTGAWASGLIALLLAPGAHAAPGHFNVSYLGEFQGFAPNNLGDVVGQRTDPDAGRSDAAVYLDGALSHPAALADGGSARDINDSGQVASTVRSIVGGINEWGWIVGRTGNAAVLWDQLQTYDLGTLASNLPAGSTLYLKEAWDVNEAGQIVTQGVLTDIDFNTVAGSFLLSPVPEPTSAALLALGHVTLTLRLRHGMQARPVP